MMIGEALMAAQTQLAPVSESPRLDAELLLEKITGFSRGQMLIRLRDSLPAADHSAFEQLVARRGRGEPVAYLIEERGFWTLTLKVTPAVLVPRPETELLVEWALDLLRPNPAPRLADLGTGSGAIALALASELPQADILATDLSVEALAIARENALTCQLHQVQFISGSWFEPLSGQSFDLLVSNPPYIARGDRHLQALQHEPLSALTDGADGLQAIRTIIADAPVHLRPGAWLLLEHGYDQGEAVRGLFQQHGFTDIQTRRDLGSQERATGGRWP